MILGAAQPKIDDTATIDDIAPTDLQFPGPKRLRVDHDIVGIGDGTRQPTIGNIAPAIPESS